MKKLFGIAHIAVALFLANCASDPPTPPDPSSGQFTLLTYNIAGLPQGVSPSNPEKNIPLISPLLNKFDIVLVQEDFYYHDELISHTKHPYQSEPDATSSQLPFGDGLNRFSNFVFSTLQREAWNACSNEMGNDCFATKGFSVAETEMAPGQMIDIYNIHMDSGGSQADFEARERQVEQLVQTIKTRSKGKAVILAGDTNLHTESRQDDQGLFRILLEDAGLSDACRSLSCDTELVDRVLFRSSSRLHLAVISWQIAPDFVDEQGNRLSDHFAIRVKFNWETD